MGSKVSGVGNRAKDLAGSDCLGCGSRVISEENCEL